MTPARRRTAGRLALGAAALWPFLLTSGQAHRVATQALAAVLVAASLVVTLGWLRTITFFQPASLGAAGWVTAALLAAGRPVPVALVAAALTGAAVAGSCLLLAGGAPRRGLPAASLLVAAVVSLALLPNATSRPFPRPVLLGVDLAGERPMYLAGLTVVVLILVALTRLRRSDVARRLATVGAGEELALRCAVDLRRAWTEGVVLAGALSGTAGWLLALQARAAPEAGASSLTAAVLVLAYPLLGGSSSLLGAGAVAALLTVVPALGEAPLLHHGVLAGAALGLAAALRPDGVAGLVLSGRRTLGPLGARGWETLRWRVSR